MEPKELVTNKLLVWVSPLSFISKWLLKERNGKQPVFIPTCLRPYISSQAFLSIPLRSVSLFQIMIQKYFLTLSRSVPSSTCQLNVLSSLLASLASLPISLPLLSYPFRSVIRDNYIEIISHLISHTLGQTFLATQAMASYFSRKLYACTQITN